MLLTCIACFQFPTLVPDYMPSGQGPQQTPTNLYLDDDYDYSYSGSGSFDPLDYEMPPSTIPSNDELVSEINR